MSEDSTDRLFMQEALGLARMGWGLTSPNPMVGAVVVRDGVIIGRGYHFKAGEAHAEVNAFADVARHGFDAKGATLYVTLEPCCTTGRTPPCTDAILASGVKRVVIGSSDPNPHHAGRGIELLRAAGIEVTVGVEQSACSELNRPFFKWIATGKPFVILKMAMTLDGKIATASGESKWITGPEARRRVQALRRLSDAIMVGGETVRQDRPQLTVREPDSWPRQPLRIIASRSMDDEEVAFFFPDGNAERVELETNEEWHSLMVRLGARNITCLLIEGGGELAAAAIDGTLIEPGGQFSFNFVVGERTAARGYLPAKIIFNGQFTDGIGGGVCQVSSTVYNAALLAGMKISEYHPHSLPVSYVAPSFDAMVNSAGSDLRFENETALPVYIRAEADGERLTISVFGEKTDRRFVRESRTVEVIPAPPEIVTEDDRGEYPDLPAGEIRVISYSKEGLKSMGILSEYKGERLVSRKVIRKDTYQPLQGTAVRGCA